MLADHGVSAGSTPPSTASTSISPHLLGLGRTCPGSLPAWRPACCYC
jgi:hypothetical protein